MGGLPGAPGARGIATVRRGLGSVTRAVAVACALLHAGGTCAGELKLWTAGKTPGLVLKDLQGTTHSLADYRGKVVLINFWATWCLPCRDEMPSMRRLRQKLAGRPFEVMAINLAESETKVQDFLRGLPLDFTIVLDRNSEARRDWKIRVLPTSFVIAPDGTIRYSVIGEIDWDDEVAARPLLRLVPQQ